MLGAGVIINTVRVVITGDFFGLPGIQNNGTNTNQTTNNQNQANPGSLGEVCTAGNSCNTATGLTCHIHGSGTICVRQDGNRNGEACIDANDCASNLGCDIGSRTCIAI